MTNILTAAEAANVLRCETTDPLMVNLLDAVDLYIKNATGRDWTADSPINPVAKSAGRMLLVMWYENPGMIHGADTTATLHHGLRAVLAQLEVETNRYMNFAGLSGAGSIALPMARVGDTVVTLVGVIGVSGDRHTDFETVITVDGQIQQSATGDLSANYYRAYLKPVSLL